MTRIETWSVVSTIHTQLSSLPHHKITSHTPPHPYSLFAVGHRRRKGLRPIPLRQPASRRARRPRRQRRRGSRCDRGILRPSHRHEVLERPQYARLQIGVLRGEQSVITRRLVGGLSSVPYAEPIYLSKGFHGPYYTEVCEVFVLPSFFISCLSAHCLALWSVRILRDSRRFLMRSFTPTRRSASSTENDPANTFSTRWRTTRDSPLLQSILTRVCSEVNLHAMRLGPGKHLKVLSLFHGLVKPEEVSFVLSSYR
jgi:hypothetical protein